MVSAGARRATTTATAAGPRRPITPPRSRTAKKPVRRRQRTPLPLPWASPWSASALPSMPLTPDHGDTTVRSLRGSTQGPARPSLLSSKPFRSRPSRCRVVGAADTPISPPGPRPLRSRAPFCRRGWRAARVRGRRLRQVLLGSAGLRLVRGRFVLFFGGGWGATS